MNENEKTPMPLPLENEAGRQTQKPKGKRLAATDFSEADRERFWSKVAIKGADECWEWQRWRDKDGYGRFGKLRSHRVSYAIHHGITPNDRLVCHSCDNPPCCNPGHLFLGTNQENVSDCVSKNRQAQGDRVGRKLYPERYPVGDNHPFRKDPSLCASGDRNGSRVHIERMPRGEGHTHSKLTEIQVIEIRRLHASGISCKKIAQMYGLVKSTPWFIIKRKTWKHIP